MASRRGRIGQTVSTDASPPAHLEFAAAALVPSAAYGFVRVFAEQNAALPLIGAALLSTALAVAARRLRIPLVLSAVLSFVALVVLISSRYAPGTARFGVIPSGESISVLRTLGRDGLDQFRELKAPVDPLDPFIAAAMIAAWVMAFLTDWGALRLRLAFEPVLPAGLLFIFSAVLGSGERRLLPTIFFAGAVLLWAVTQRVTDLATNSVWLSVDRRRGPADLAKNAALVGLVAVVLGPALGPRLPGAQAEELYTWREKGDPVRTVISPYVSIENRLATQQSTLLFTVRADRASYWRLAGLDTYENGFWSTRGTFEEEDGDLPGLKPTAGSTMTVRQEFTIENLAAIWLPAAFAPSRVIESESPVTWNADTGSLTVDNSRPTSDGSTYTVESVLPLYTADELRAAPTEIPESIQERYLLLPDDLTPRVASEALTITAGAETTYDKALALQEYFRAFEYNIRLGPRQDDPIEQFLDERVGFCQQFSGTMAVMARSLGIPARVAVGFTWGDPVDGEPGLYRVTGRQTHAWPELWFSGLGWVAFEPTPGRGSPDALYNPVEAQQDSLVQPDQPGQETTTTTRLGSALVDGEELPFDPGLGLGDETGSSAIDTTSGGSGVPTRLLIVLAIVGAYSLGAPAFHRLRRARRVQQATTPADRIEVAWAEAAEALETGFGLTRPASATRGEWASRLSSEMRVPSEPIERLGAAITRARFAGSQLPQTEADEAVSASAEIQNVARGRQSWWKRWLADLDPRRLLKPTQRQLTSA
ncbi:MAG: transglutaminase-like putative cysteine protease [Acidimicrobiales bacterium]|jgi:transglutaminase-like putative cysteine protease